MQRKILSQRGLVDLYGTGRKNVIFLPILTDALQRVRARAMALTDHNIDQALELFTGSLLRASECMKKHVHTGISRRYSLWFVDDCRMAKIMLSPC